MCRKPVGRGGDSRRGGAAPAWGVLLSASLLVLTAEAQDAAAPAAPFPETAAGRAFPTGPTAAFTEASNPSGVLPSDVQLVRFHGPEGVQVEVLGPPSEPIPPGDGSGLATFGFKVGVGYRLRVSNIPNRPEAEIFPVFEVSGHLHRPANIDPSRFPIRVALTRDDIEDVIESGRMVTQVIYLEDPNLALPLKLSKDEPPIVSLTAAENPLKVASKLGRVMAVMRLGTRKPSDDEVNLSASEGLAGLACPFVGPSGAPCGLPCGPVCGTPPPPGRPWLPKDEFLCDGGDQENSASFGGDGGLTGIDPRDTVMKFADDKRSRILPTNVVCVYSPRFATVRMSIGAVESLNVQELKTKETIEKLANAESRRPPKRLVMNQGAELNRLRERASSFKSRVYVGESSELRVLAGYESHTHVAGLVREESAQKFRVREKAMIGRSTIGIGRINTAESLVVAGIVEGAGEAVTSWPARETVGVETPPGRPGVAIIKTVDADSAEQGDTLTYTITYKNTGNVPIRAVSIVDSLLPRLEYVPESASGPKGAIFSAAENRAGSSELRWDLKDPLKPGEEGAVSFKAIVR